MIQNSRSIQQLTDFNQENHTELWMMLRQLDQTLSSRDREVINLYLEGYKNKEIAEFLKVNPSTVSRKINEIKQSLVNREDGKEPCRKRGERSHE